MLDVYLQSVIRTVVPVLVTAIAAWFLRFGVNLDNEALTTLLSALVGGAYYSLVRWAEEKWPQVGVLLGRKGTPSYEAAGD